MIPVEILEVPYALNSSEESASLVPNPPSLNLTVDKGQSFHLTCAAIAGVEDHLVWLLDGQPVPYNTSDPSEVSVCEYCIFGYFRVTLFSLFPAGSCF